MPCADGSAPEPSAEAEFSIGLAAAAIRPKHSHILVSSHACHFIYYHRACMILMLVAVAILAQGSLGVMLVGLDA